MAQKHFLLVVAGLLVLFPPTARAAGRGAVTFERIDTTHAWASPCWGQHAPKIVRNARGEIWTVNFGGLYGHERATLNKRLANGRWVRGRTFDSLYQPSMIFLDGQGRLNYIQNSQYLPIRHYRSRDTRNLDNFELVATGNGIPDGRGWYVGAAVHGSTMYMAYVTLAYDFYLTWKGITDQTWHPAVLIERGRVDTALGNHAWLYPQFAFSGDTGYVVVSSSVDGSKQNTYNQVYLLTFPAADPSHYTRELIYDGAVGYYSFANDLIVASDRAVLCSLTAGRHVYGPERSDILPSGTYVVVKKPGASSWATYPVSPGDGRLTLQSGKDGDLYAMVVHGSWDTESRWLLTHSSDGGATWQEVECAPVPGSAPKDHLFGLQLVHGHSGSTGTDNLYGLVTNMTGPKSGDGTYPFELLLLTVHPGGK